MVCCRYIHQVVTPEVNEVAKELMKSLIAFQARHYQREPVKARIKSVARHCNISLFSKVLHMAWHHYLLLAC